MFIIKQREFMVRFTKKKIFILATSLILAGGIATTLFLLLKPKTRDIEPRVLDKQEDYDYILWDDPITGNGVAYITGIKYPATELIIPDYIEANDVKFKVIDILNIGHSNTITKIHLPKYLNGLNPNKESVNPTLAYREVFQNLPNLKEYEIDSSNENFKTKDGVLFKLKWDDSWLLHKYPGGKSDKSYTIPNDFGKLRLSYDAFSSSVNLENIEVGISYDGTEEYYYHSVDGILYEYGPGINKITGEEVPSRQIVAFPGGKRGSFEISNDVGLSYYAFGETPHLTSLKYPENYDGYLGITELTKFDSLTNIEIPVSSQTYKTIENVVYSKDESKLYFCPSKVAGKSYTIREGVKIIDSCGFVGCSDLESLTLSSTIESYHCRKPGDWNTNIQNYFVHNNNKNYYSIDGFLFQKGTNYLLRIPEGRTGTVTIPSGTTQISEIHGCKFKKLVIPNSVTEILTIYDCINLEEISIPDSVIKYGTYVTPSHKNSSRIFYRCVSLQKIHLGKNIDCFEFNESSFYTSSNVEITASEENPYLSIRDGLILNKAETELIKCYKPLAVSITIPPTVEVVNKKATEALVCAQELSFTNSVKTWDPHDTYFNFSRINFNGSLEEFQSLGLWVPTGCTLFYNGGQISK